MSLHVNSVVIRDFFSAIHIPIDDNDVSLNLKIGYKVTSNDELFELIIDPEPTLLPV